MVSQEALKLHEILRDAAKAVDMDLPHQRAAGEHAEDMSSEPEGVTYEEAYTVDGLAPERPFPSAVDDAAAGYRWLLKEGHSPERVIIAGDSSAGGLAVATMLKLREDGSPLPAGGVPISPWVDLACTGETLETNATADLTVTKASLQRMAGQSGLHRY
jgi:alpha/beta hydrolase fold